VLLLDIEERRPTYAIEQAALFGAIGNAL
jgi:hypothetical protein